MFFSRIEKFSTSVIVTEGKKETLLIVYRSKVISNFWKPSMASVSHNTIMLCDVA